MTEGVRALAARLLAASRYAMPIADAQAQIKERRAKLLASETTAPEPDFAAPEAMPTAHPAQDASSYARGFWARMTNDSPTQTPGRAPKGDRTPGHERFRVLDGGRPPDGDNDP